MSQGHRSQPEGGCPWLHQRKFDQQNNYGQKIIINHLGIKTGILKINKWRERGRALLHGRCQSLTVVSVEWSSLAYSGQMRQFKADIYISLGVSLEHG